MRVALLLLGYAALVATAAPPLARAAWVVRAPRLAICVWQALSVTVVVSAVLAGLALIVPTVPVSGSLAALLQACALMLRERYATPGGAVVAASGISLALVLLGRVGWCLAAGLLRARGARSRHAAVLAMVGRTHVDPGVTVLDDDRPVAYCLPGHGHRIVLTSAALAVLEPEELDAVIAHERAHIRQRHHLILVGAEALERAFPRVPLFAVAAEQTRRLVEMAADDAAIARTGPLSLAAALVELAGSVAPAASLAASGGHAAGRVRRLLAGHRPLGRAAAWGGALVAGALLAFPLVLAAQPAVAATGMNSCPLREAPRSRSVSPECPAAFRGCLVCSPPSPKAHRYSG
ncbi:M56 family metallopeptidase [Streptomyces montanisoli]|uniref:M56 family metallopeptidase n=1 Tax=Streptomyces montanisoli TaxID=2798581 RepID=A0A940RVG7_9ACTN|nr:M56 family metallopeptidase [Streptomyces montanisoli]MBP0456083.1 M56 family metallopeptidase [Streptomyces montanisoli]